MTRFLLDTNILSDVIRDPAGRIARKIGEVGEALVCTSIIVAAELRYGAAQRSSTRLTKQVDVVLGAIEILPFESPAELAYGRLRAALERAGTPIGGNDLLIAAQALSLGHCVITDNEREFARVKGLQSANWLR